MKRSEFKAMLRTSPSAKHNVLEAELVARLAEDAMSDLLKRIARTDITQLWDPEEPQLPKRLSIVGEDISWGDSSPWPKKREDVYREAAARYNAVERLVDDRNFPAGLTPATVRRTLEDEREKLR